MPWKPSEATRHSKKATGPAAHQWAAVANKVLAETGDEGRAVREANSAIKHLVPRRIANPPQYLRG